MRQNAYIEISAHASLIGSQLVILSFRLDKRRGGLMTGLIAEKADKTDRIDETDWMDKTDGVDKTDRVDKTDKADKTDHPDSWGIRNHLTRLRVLFRSFGFDDSAAVTGVLGFCFHEQTVAVCYLAKHRARTNLRQCTAVGADFVLANIEIPQIEDPDSLSLCEQCQRLFHLSVDCPFPQVWVSTDLASGAEVAVSVPGSLRRTLVFAAAQELGQYLSRAGVDLSESGRGDSWLEQAKPDEPPVFDYKLLHALQGVGHLSGKALPESSTTQARLWWMSGYAARSLLTHLQERGLAIAGVTPDGVALYWGLQRLWHESNSDLSALRGPWVLVEGGSQTNLWLFSDSWFQRRLPLDSLDALHTSDLDKQTKVILWLINKDSVEALADSLSKTWAVFDNTLSPWSRGMRYQGPALDVPSIIALGSALQGGRQPSGDWQKEDAAPIMNLLPWRGAWLQRRQGRLLCQLVGLALVVSGCAYMWFEALQRKADLSHQLLIDAREEHQQILKAQQQARTQDHARSARRAALTQLGLYGKYGQRQLLNIEALLALIPECFVVHRVALTKNSATVFGLASNVTRLITLPEKVFAAFSRDQHRSLESWPTLLMGSNAASNALPADPIITSVADANDPFDNEFSLRVVFAPAEERVPLKAEFSGSDRSVD